MKKLLTLFLIFFSLNAFAQDNIEEVYFQNGQTPKLYLKCGNDFQFLLSPNMNPDNLEYKIEGGKLILGKSYEKITIVPTSAKVTLSIFYERELIKKQTFSVQLIPLPTVRVRYFHKTLKKFPQKIILDVIPESNFKDQLPADTRYKVSRFTVQLVRNREVIVKDIFTEEITPSDEAIRSYIKMIKAEPNENWRLVVEVKGVQRMNFQNQIENVSMPATIFSLPFKL